MKELLDASNFIHIKPAHLSCQASGHTVFRVVDAEAVIYRAGQACVPLLSEETLSGCDRS